MFWRQKQYWGYKTAIIENLERWVFCYHTAAINFLITKHYQQPQVSLYSLDYKTKIIQQKNDAKKVTESFQICKK